MQIENETERFEILYFLAKDMTKNKDLDESLQIIVENAQKLLNTDTAFLGLRDEETGEIEIRNLSGIKTEEFKEIKLAPGKGLGGLVAEKKDGLIVEDYFSDKTIPRAHSKVENIVRKEGLISAVAVPIQMGSKNLGVLYVFNRRKSNFTETDIKTLSVAGNLAALEITRRRLELRENELDAITKTTSDAVVLMDAEGKISYWNPAAEKMFGWSEEELKRKQNPKKGLIKKKKARKGKIFTKFLLHLNFMLLSVGALRVSWKRGKGQLSEKALNLLL